MTEKPEGRKERRDRERERIKWIRGFVGLPYTNCGLVVFYEENLALIFTCICVFCAKLWISSFLPSRAVSFQA